MLPSMAMGEGPSSCTLHFTLLIHTYVKILNVLYKIVIKETQSLILSLDWPRKNIPVSAKPNGFTSCKAQSGKSHHFPNSSGKVC